VEFDWDDGNWDKNRRHGVQDWEIEEAVNQGFVSDERSSEGELRRILFGRARTSGKFLRIVYTIRVRNCRELIRPISPVDMGAKTKAAFPTQNEMKYKKRQNMTVVHSLDEIPTFESENEERDWWASHDLSDDLYEHLEKAEGPNGSLVYILRKKAKTAPR